MYCLTERFREVSKISRFLAFLPAWQGLCRQLGALQVEKRRTNWFEAKTKLEINA